MWHPLKKKKNNPKQTKQCGIQSGGKSIDYVESVRESQYYKRGLLCPGLDFSNHKLKLWPQVLEPLVAFCSYTMRKNITKIKTGAILLCINFGITFCQFSVFCFKMLIGTFKKNLIYWRI